MSNDIRDLLERMSAIESGITPVGVRHGLNAQQKQADQLPALFRPHKIRALGAKTDPQHPMHGKLVGASEGRLAEAMAEIEEDMLGKIKNDLTAYLDQLAQQDPDDGRRDRKTPELDKLGRKDSVDRDLIARAKQAVEQGQVEEDPTQQDLAVEPPTPPVQNPTLPESQVVRTLALEDGTVMEIHGTDQAGYEIRRGDRCMRSRFPSLDLAEAALALFRSRHGSQLSNQDYIEER